jgi:nitrogen fixation/metabolism regulation signal transduction histidine kinase
VFWLALGAGAPALALALVDLARAPWDALGRALAAAALVALWLGSAFALRERVLRPLQTISNLIAALREGDTSIRARGADVGNPLGLALWEVNALAEQMRRNRYDALEALSLVRQVMESIDVALFAFDPDGRLRLVNANGEELLRQPAERALGRDAAALGLAETLEGETPRLLDLPLPGRAGRWELRRGIYRHGGLPHRLVVLSDLGRSLREEELQAWQRLIRVLSHEINNSLAPIQSIAGSLRKGLERDGAAAGMGSDLREGLGVIEGRAQSLARFMQAYARLTRLPAPAPRTLEAAPVLRRIAALETRMPVEVREGPAATLHADPDQVEQLLINLVRNAADAALETGGRAWIGWSADARGVEVQIEDEGPGVADTANLFVPGFTTKPEGSGTGLALGRQIAEAHGGTLTLGNREGARGAIARLWLPATAAGAAPRGVDPGARGE